MRKSVTQEFAYGCGIACYAFVLGITYKQAVQRLGEAQAKSDRFYVKDVREELNKAGLPYGSKHIKPHNRRLIYTEGAIVLVRRSKRYPTGHYLVRHEGQWMDPWINLPRNNDILKAKSGFRRRLPGVPMYVLVPVYESGDVA